MKIGIISNIYEAWGGSEELWANLAKEAIAGGHTVIISYYRVGPMPTQMVELKKKGCICLGRRGYIKPGLPALQRIWFKGMIFLKNILNNPYTPFFRLKPDIIIHNGSNYYYAEDIFFYKACLKYPAPLYLINQIIPDQYRFITEAKVIKAQQIINRAKLYFFVSKRNLQTAQRQLAFNFANGVVIRNPVNITTATYLEYPRGLQCPTFAVVGNLLTNHKGQDILLEALSSEKWKGRDWRLNLFGTGINESYLKNLIALYGLSEKVRLAGRNNDIQDIWRNHHFLILPSLMEGTSLAMTEAMMSGRMVIVTDVGGSREWVKDNYNGYLMSSASAPAIDETLERAWQNSAMWEGMGRMAHQTALELYDPNPGATLLNKILSSL